MMKHRKSRSRHYILIKGLIVLMVFLLPLWTLFSQNISEETAEDESQRDGFSLSFPEVLKDAEGSTSYREALKAYEKSLLEVELYSHPGDAGLSLTPGVKTQWTDFEDPGQTDLNLSAGFSFFLGRSPAQEDRYESFLRDSDAALLKKEEALNEAATVLYILYSDLRLLQEESDLLEMEKILEKERYEGMLQLYAGGTASLDDLENVLDELQLLEDALNQNFLKQRLTWFSLQQARGKTSSSLTTDIPELKEYMFDIPDISRPSRLMDQTMIINEGILKTENSIVSLDRSVERLNERDFDLIMKPTISYGDYSFTINYALDTRSMNLNMAVPLAVINSADSGDSQDKWTGGFSVTLNMDSGKEGRLEEQVLTAEIQRQQMLLQEQVDTLSLAVRSAYQRLLQAGEARETADSSLERQNRLKEAVYLRYETGTALKSDLLAADLAVLRGEWRVSSSEVELRQAYLALAELIGDLPF